VIEALPRVAIVGCGLVGQRRAHAMPPAQLIACADVDSRRAEAVAALATECVAFTDWRELLVRADCDIVIVATPHDSLAEIAAAAAASGRHVLVEKPAGRHPSDVEPILAAARRANVKVRVGFNHRFHRALRKARELVDAGALGELMFVRGRYGHGGRPGYDREWRADPARSGGGELMDQGPHLIDLARWFLGDFVTVQGIAETFYWDMPVDDNCFMLLRTAKRRTAFLHVSCTEWKNTFSFEIYGRQGKLDISGLGGSYGPERVAFYRMLPGMGPPETTIYEYPMELAELIEDIRLDREPTPALADALAVLHIIERIYKAR
jgi:predicted dehydrogenase